MHPVSSLNPLFWELDKKFELLEPRELTASIKDKQMSEMMFFFFVLKLCRHDRAYFEFYAKLYVIK